MTILEEIFAHKLIEVETCKRKVPLAELRSASENAPPPADFIHALRSAGKLPALIAEVKFASPSKGILVDNPDPVSLAQTYAAADANAISVLTDEVYFHGHLDYLSQIHAALPEVPILRKDFICDPYQVYEARLAGASAVLLIAACLDMFQLADLHSMIISLGMAALVEVHNQAELEAVSRIQQLSLLGVNNRDLRTFEVNLQTCIDLRTLVPSRICFVAESGIQNAADVQRILAAGVDAMLVGEALVMALDVAGKIHSLYES